MHHITVDERRSGPTSRGPTAHPGGRHRVPAYPAARVRVPRVRVRCVFREGGLMPRSKFRGVDLAALGSLRRRDPCGFAGSHRLHHAGYPRCSHLAHALSRSYAALSNEKYHDQYPITRALVHTSGHAVRRGGGRRDSERSGGGQRGSGRGRLVHAAHIGRRGRAAAAGGATAGDATVGGAAAGAPDHSLSIVALARCARLAVARLVSGHTALSECSA